MLKKIFVFLTRVVDGVNYAFFKNFTNTSLFYLFLTTFGLMNLEFRLQNLGMSYKEINLRLKLWEINNFIAECAIWESNYIPKNLPLVNFTSSIININNIESFDVDLLYNIVQDYKKVPQSVKFIDIEQSNLWKKLKNSSNFYSENGGYENVLNTKKTYHNLLNVKIYILITSSLLIFSDFALKLIFN